MGRKKKITNVKKENSRKVMRLYHLRRREKIAKIVLELIKNRVNVDCSITALRETMDIDGKLIETDNTLYFISFPSYTMKLSAPDSLSPIRTAKYLLLEILRLTPSI